MRKQWSRPWENFQATSHLGQPPWAIKVSTLTEIGFNKKAHVSTKSQGYRKKKFESQLPPLGSNLYNIFLTVSSLSYFPIAYLNCFQIALPTVELWKCFPNARNQATFPEGLHLNIFQSVTLLEYGLSDILASIFLEASVHKQHENKTGLTHFSFSRTHEFSLSSFL